MKKIKVRKKKNKNIIFIVSGIVLLLIVLVAVVFFIMKDDQTLKEEKIVEKKKIEVMLISDLEVEIQSKVNLLSFVENIKNGEIITEDSEIDTSKLGYNDLKLLIKNEDGEEEEYSFEIKVVDTIEPVIEAKKEFTIYVGNKIDLLKDVIVTDNSLEEIVAEVEGQYDINKVGEYKLNYIAIDSSGNSNTSEFVLKVISDPNNYSFTTSKGYSGKVVNGVTYIDGVLIVNKTYSLPSNYGNGLTSETMNAFNKMKGDATSLGLNIYISSGYRSYYDQKYIYNNYVSYDGVEKADTYSARAGHSEHQTGLAFDLNSIDDTFTYTDEGKWVHDNCYRYGLIIRYPKGKDSITGYMHESWHLRYVGVDLATKLYNDGDWITLEEYYGIDSKYK